MAVTIYHTLNGRIIGETTAGVRTGHLTDALGSVTATVNSAGAVVNRYRYKPYGALLSKTGSGADPSNQWVGSLGYRQTGKKYSDVYVRARHYDTANGRWTTKDPIGFGGGDYNLLRYAISSPSTRSDNQGTYCPPVPACGPRITTHLTTALDAIREQWKRHPEKRIYACDRLTNPIFFLNAWDICELHGRQQVFDDFIGVNCETTPDCGGSAGATVQVGDECFNTGSVNYAAFGVMYRLCCISGNCESNMVKLITLYKQGSPNYSTSVDWAIAGYRGLAEWSTDAQGRPP